MEKCEFDYYTYYVGEGRENYMPSESLVWNVFREDCNTGKIYVFNIFNAGLLESLVKINKKYKDDTEFLQEVRSWLGYYYWSKSEHEVIITSWPPYISKEEYERISKEEIRVRESVNLTTEEKLDVYTQVLMNWEAFRFYLLANRNKIPKRSKR